MTMRVTPFLQISQAISSIESQSNQLNQLEQEASTGSRLLTPSVDPVATVSVLAENTQNQQLTTYMDNIQTAQTSLNASVSALQQANNIFTQAEQIASEGSNSTNDATSNEALATQVDTLINSLLSVANTQNGNTYLFGGTASNQAPFSVASTNSAGLPQSIVYNGSAQRASVIIGQEQTVNTLYPGSQIFQQQTRGTTTYQGTTGAAVGTGTDSATGQGTLLVAHTATTYQAGSGIQPGSSSAAADTILGPNGSHKLTVVDTSGTGAGGTVSLDGGPAIAFTNADTNLKVTGPTGSVVYVNTTAITPGFSGSVAIAASGTLSVDGGATSVPINFSSNQVVANGSTGAVTNVNSSNIQSTGTELLTYTGTYDAFQALTALRDDLRNTSGLTQNQQVQAISQSLSELKRVQQGITNVVGEQSDSLQQMQSLSSYLSQSQLNTQKQISNLQAADVTQVVVGLQSQQNIMQLTLATVPMILNTSLLNFLK